MLLNSMLARQVCNLSDKLPGFSKTIELCLKILYGILHYLNSIANNIEINP